MSMTQPMVKDAGNIQSSTFAFFERFPDEATAREYLINARWPNGVICPHCGHDEVYRIRDGKLFRCKDKRCSKQFTLKIGTVMEDSPLPVRKWLFAMYLFGISQTGVASTRMAKLIGVTQKTAWHMDHRLREAFADDEIVLEGVVEADETYVDSTKKNKYNGKVLKADRGSSKKLIVFDVKQRHNGINALPVKRTDTDAFSGAVKEHFAAATASHTGKVKAYGKAMPRRESINRSVSECVTDKTQTTEVESLWSILKRAHYSVYHWWDKKHRHRYVSEIATRTTIRHILALDDSDGSGINMIGWMMAGMSGKTLTYKALTRG